MKKLIRTFPKVETSYSFKQLVELNVLIMQAFLPEALTNKEKDILVAYCLISTTPKDVFSKATKQAVILATGLKNFTTLNEYNKRLRNKMAFVFKDRIWQINPMFVVPNDISELELSINIKNRDALERPALQDA